MSLGWDQPLWLLALPLAAFVVVAARRSGASRRVTQRRLATWARAAAVALLVVALAGPRVGLAGEEVDVVFLADGSDSVGPAGRAAALDWVERALAGQSPDDRAALALFGRNARLEYPLSDDPPGADPAVIVDSSATDLAAAARLGQGVLGSERRRRAVLLTDGRATQGDLAEVAQQLADGGVSLDVVTLPGGGTADVLVEEVRSPSRVREGEAYEVTAVLRNTGDAAADALVVTTADGVQIDRRTVSVPPGRTEFAVPATAGEPGTVRYDVRLASAASTVPENDTGRAAVQVAGPPKVLVLEGADGAGEELEAALTSAAVPTERRTLGEGLPTLDRLLDYDSVVLVDVPAPALGVEGMTALDTYVREAGRGVVAVGGEQSFGLGGYGGTPLEELLPVFAEVTDPTNRPTVAEALVVDVSGSMAACHCADDSAFGGPSMQEGGVVKTDIAKEAISRAIAALESQDQVGVLAFNQQSEWVVPLQALPEQAVIDEGLARIHPDGGTSITPAVRRAIEGLQDVDARLRHIVLFTDGFDPAGPGGGFGGPGGEELLAVAEEAREAGVTLSVVATGEGSMDFLEEMAEIGGGRFYPGRDLMSIPDIIALEVQFAARPIVNEGEFFPVVAGLAAATEDLDVSPPLRGYVATTAKPTARTLLTIGEQRDPLLASWRAGLGTATAWTSDATARWSAEWVTWENYSTFWADVVKETFPSREQQAFALDANATAAGVSVSMTVADALPSDAEASAVVTTPDGERLEVTLDRVALDRFAADVPASAEGVYAVTGRLERGENDAAVDAVSTIRSYAQEYAIGDADPGLLARAAEVTGGRVDPDPASAFDAEGLAPGQRAAALWPLLAVLALGLAAVDVGLRRLRLERADWARARQWLGARAGRLRRSEGVADRTAAAEGLLAAKGRSRAAASAPPHDQSRQLPPAPDASRQAVPPPPPITPLPAPHQAPEIAAPKRRATPPPEQESSAQGLLAARNRARGRAAPPDVQPGKGGEG